MYSIWSMSTDSLSIVKNIRLNNTNMKELNDHEINQELHPAVGQSKGALEELWKLPERRPQTYQARITQPDKVGLEMCQRKD